MTNFRSDPGPCGICGAAHTTCTPRRDNAVSVVQLPARDALGRAALVAPPSVALDEVHDLAADRVQAGLPAGEVTTGTYRGDRPRRR